MPQHVAAISAAKVAGKTIKKDQQAKRTSKRKANTKKKDDDGPELPLASFTIPQFCRINNISQAYYYKLQRAGQGPREMRMNVPNKTSENKSKKKSGKVLISVEAAAAWRVEREQASIACESAEA